MKRILFLAIILLSNFLNAQISKGTWNWKSENGNNNLEFTISSVENNKIQGNYCSVYFKGKKIDCDSGMENEPDFILDEIGENIYLGKFTSNYSSTKGILKISFFQSTNNIKLELVEPPKGEFYLPKSALLSQ